MPIRIVTWSAVALIAVLITLSAAFSQAVHGQPHHPSADTSPASQAVTARHFGAGSAEVANCPTWQPPDSTSYQSFPNPGIYGFYDWPHLEPRLYPWLSGGHQVFPWNSIEDLVKGGYYWEGVDRWIAAEALLGKAVGIAFNTYDGTCCGGDWLPAWFKQAHGGWPEGDGFVTCTWTDGNGTHTEDIPMYWSQAYLAAFEDFIAVAAARYRDDPRVAFVEVSSGIYGETAPGELSEELDQCLLNAGLTSERWVDTVNRIVDVYQRHWHDKPLLSQYAPWYRYRVERREHTDHAGGVGVGLKYNKILVDHDDQVVRSDSAQIHPDVCRTGQYDPMLQYAGQVPIAWEGESIYYKNPGDTLWALINALNKHPTYMLIGKNTIRSSDLTEQWALDLARRYTGRTIADTPGVWVALRDPKPTNADGSTRWYPQWGNFEFWLRQDDAAPGGRTIAAWDITDQPWGRYTRRTDQASGNPYMAFDIDDSFLFDSANQPVTIKVMHLDASGDTWELQYDAAGNEDYKVAGIVQKGTSGRWRQATFTLTDAELANQQDGYDFRIWSRGDGNEYVSFVEVLKGMDGGPADGRISEWANGQTGGSASANRKSQIADGGSLTALQPSNLQPATFQPPNDDLDNATLIPSFPFEAVLDTREATVAADDPVMGCGVGTNSHTVWYRFVAVNNGYVTFNTAGSDYDTVVAVWQGSRGALERRGCNDDVGYWADSSLLNVPVASGQTYVVEVARRSDGPARPGDTMTLQASFHTCTYAQDETTVQAILEDYGVSGSFDSFIEYVPATNGGRCAITGLHIRSKGLQGPAPASLGRLVNLQRLDLANNALVDPLPTDLASLKYLVWLDLHDNRLSNGLPAVLGSLHQLQGLDMAENRLSGSLPAALGNLDHLQYLSLSQNEVSGDLPGWLGQLADLRQLWLGYNEFSGPLPNWWPQLSRLQALSLAENQLGGPVPSALLGLDSLQHLYLSGNQLDGMLPVGLGDLSSARSIFLDNNHLTGTLPGELGALPQLEMLRLDYNRLGGTLPPGLGQAGQLRGLFLQHNQLGGALPDTLGNLANLQGLYLSDNQFTGPLSTSLGALGQLRQLHVNRNPFTGPLPASLTGLDRLWSADFSNTGLCEPVDPAFQAWRAGVRFWQGPGQVCGSTATPTPTPTATPTPSPAPTWTPTPTATASPPKQLRYLPVILR